MFCVDNRLFDASMREPLVTRPRFEDIVTFGPWPDVDQGGYANNIPSLRLNPLTTIMSTGGRLRTLVKRHRQTTGIQTRKRSWGHLRQFAVSRPSVFLALVSASLIGCLQRDELSSRQRFVCISRHGTCVL